MMRLAVLMALRVKGRATSAAIVEATRLPAEVVRAMLDDARASGAAREVGDDATVTLTPRGHAHLAELLAAEDLDRSSLGALYERFVAIDRIMKDRISAWQLASSAAPAAASALRAVDATAVAHELGIVAARLAPYEARLRAALGAVESGDARFVASPFVDSLHQIWFELHEDLLVTLGKTRAA